MERASIALDRRGFGKGLMATAFAGLALHSRHVSAAIRAEARGFGTPIPDPAGILDLPPGFSYKIVSQYGQAMSDGHKVPNSADGMGCTALPDGRLCLMRNHELGADELDHGACAVGTSGDAAAFDCLRGGNGEALPGGVSTLILDPATLAVEEQYLSLVGTIYNCSGGITPWGSWLSCEEDVSRAGGLHKEDHGWVFEMPVAPGGLVAAEPIKAMGRFNHEAAVVDPRSGAVYMTEDRQDSLFYRFLPAVPGELRKGGRLQALAFKAIRRLYPDYSLWRDFPYEYEFDKLAIDVINGSPLLREWVDDTSAAPGDLDALAAKDEAAWRDERADYLLYD